MSDLLLRMPLKYEPLKTKIKKSNNVYEDANSVSSLIKLPYYDPHDLIVTRWYDMGFKVNDYSTPVFPTLSTPEPIDFATKVGELKPVKPMYDRYLWKDKLTNRYYKIRNKIKICIFRKVVSIKRYFNNIQFVWK